MMPATDLANEIKRGPSLASEPRLPSSSSANWLFIAAKSFVLFVLTVLALEVVLRIAHVGEQEYLRVDPLLGLVHLENKLVTDRSEAFAVSRISSAGLCDVEHQLVKPNGVYRIAILGDSMTEALQVPTEERFARVLEKKLNATGVAGRKYEVLNFGNGAFSTGQEYIQFVQTVAAYQPDMTILMFHQGDQEKNPPFYSNWSLRPTFALDGTNLKIRWQEFDRWRVSESALPLTLFDWGRRHSRIWGVLLQTHSTLKTDPVFQRLAGRFAAVSNVVQPLIDRALPASIRDEQLDASRKQLSDQTGLAEDLEPLPGKDAIDRVDRWQLTLSLLNSLNSRCGQAGSKFMVASLPSSQNRQLFQSEFRTIGALAGTAGFTTLDLTPSFETAANQTFDSLYLTGHLSKRGHELVADQLCQKILGLGRKRP
jgi:hypothetical protein